MPHSHVSLVLAHNSLFKSFIQHLFLNSLLYIQFHFYQVSISVSPSPNQLPSTTFRTGLWIKRQATGSNPEICDRFSKNTRALDNAFSHLSPLAKLSIYQLTIMTSGVIGSTGSIWGVGIVPSGKYIDFLYFTSYIHSARSIWLYYTAVFLYALFQQGKLSPFKPSLNSWCSHAGYIIGSTVTDSTLTKYAIKQYYESKRFCFNWYRKHWWLTN